MISLRSLLSLEEGKSSPAPTPSAASATGGSELSLWLNDYKSSGTTAAAASASSGAGSASVKSSISSFLSSFNTPAPTASTVLPSATTPSPANDSGASASTSSKWWPVGQASDETSSLVPPSHSQSSSMLPSSLSSSSSWSLSSMTGMTGADDPLLCGLSMQQRLGLFFLCVIGGVVMLALSFSFLSLLMLGTSAKFTMSYGLANILFLLSSTFLTGPTSQLKTMFAPTRAIISATYLLSLAALLYVAWQMPVFYVLFPLIAIQISALIAYVGSYLPFGVNFMKRMFAMFVATMKRLF